MLELQHVLIAVGSTGKSVWCPLRPHDVTVSLHVVGLATKWPPPVGRDTGL